VIQSRIAVKTVRQIVLAFSMALLFAAAPAVVSACPMCNQSIQEDKSLPTAYQASIIFMLAMPFTVLGGLGGLIVYKFRQHEKAMRAVYAANPSQHLPPAAQNEVGLRV